MKFAFKIGSLFFLSGCPTVWVAISCLCPQIVLRAFRPSPYPKHPAHASLSPVCWWLMQASRLLLHWELWLGAFSVGFFFFFLPVMLPSKIPKLSADRLVRGFPAVWKHLFFHDSLPRTEGVLPPFKENGLPFWVLGVLHQHSEVVLWKFLSIQMIF